LSLVFFEKGVSMAELPHLLIVGASARAAAFSALRAGLHPWCVDLFADVDLRQRCEVARLAGRYPDDFQTFIENDVPGPWMYTGGLENWPSFVKRWSGRRRLWGSDAVSLSLARSPEYLCELLQLVSMPVPALVPILGRLSREERCVIKPRKGAGGAGIRFWTKKDSGGLPKSLFYCQEFIEGESIALLFLGARGQSRLLGLTRQLVGAPWLHAAPFRY
jgi:predicted ATP-grasp superfamily ATP-dependent carboligase